MFSVGAMPLFAALGSRAFALFWSGQALSRLGDHLYQVALAWWVFAATGSAVAMGTVLVCTITPTVLFLLIGGVAVDRWPRIRVMVISDVARGVLVGGIALLMATGNLQIWHVYLASVLFGIADAFFQPAYAAAVPDLTPAEALPSANALNSLAMQTARIAGPALAGGIVTVSGPAIAFGINAVSFFISAACLVPLLNSGPAPANAEVAADGEATDAATPAGGGGLVADIREGFAIVARSPWVWMTICLYACTNVTLVGPYSIGLPALVKNDLHGDANVLGLLYAVFPVGYILGGIWAGRQGRLRRRGVIVYGGIATAGLMLAVFGLPVPIVVMALAALINGACLEVDNLVWTHTLQEQVPREKLGRVVSIDSVGSYVLMPVGFAVSGWATDALGAPAVFLIGGGLTALVAGLGLLHPAIRQMD
jgi:MFS family permease